MGYVIRSLSATTIQDFHQNHEEAQSQRHLSIDVIHGTALGFMSNYTQVPKDYGYIAILIVHNNNTLLYPNNKITKHSSRVHTLFGSSNSMTFHDQKKSNSMTFRTILGNEHIRSKYGNFKEQHNASFKPQIVNKTQLYGNLHIATHNINNKINEIKL